ncbi:GntR family transcriptional regulator [Starkeya koreensis]|uniref:GntR family transcriptional regulator n=1 Tax=Ancylobacter koreensis TaxID=266121 RepID=A0ABT0DRZ7_9HYPH|nr:GntR family transcriptional regulator [Ancylobacter koreensis]
MHRAASLSEEVYDAIFARLMALKIPPGARITVDNLVRELAVSQTPIREALGRLEGEGLVIKTHLVGYSAAPQITRARFEELYDLRLLLEPEMAGRAAAAMTDEALSALTGAAGVNLRGAGADERARYPQFARQDAVFHDMILEVGGNELVRETLAHQHTHFHIFRLMFHALVTEEALDEHEALLAAFAARDVEAARVAMRVHLERSRERLSPAFDL